MRTRTFVWQTLLVTALLVGLFSLSRSQLPQSADAAGPAPAPAATAPRAATPALTATVPAAEAARAQRVAASCWNTSCVGLMPGAQGCDGVDDVSTIGDRIWAPAVQAWVEFRHSSACNSRWVRAYWNYPQTCGLSALSIQHRKQVNGLWQTSAAQTATRGTTAFCEEGKYWTKMVPGQPGQVRMRYAEGYMAAGCTTSCVRWKWYPWTGWRG